MSIDRGVVNKMFTMADNFEASCDKRAIFLYCYGMMTDNMLEAIDQGRFHDNRWVFELLHRFADYYFDSLDRYNAQVNAPKVWEEVFKAATDPQLHVIQHLLLGINAHINYDLVLTLYDVLSPEWDRLSENERNSRYQDHCLVNTIIGQTIDKVQDELVEKYAPGMKLLDSLMGRLDEFFLLKIIEDWRDDVWNHTMNLLGNHDSVTRTAFIMELERKVVKRSDTLDTHIIIWKQ